MRLDGGQGKCCFVSTHILLVEDDKAHIELVRRAFESEKKPVRFSIAETLDEARRIIATSTPDIAIIDHLLPDGIGLEILSETKKTGRFPIIMMTSRGDEALAVQAMRSGAFDYIQKSDTSFQNLPALCETALRDWSHRLQQKAAERALRESEARFRSIFDHSNDAIFLVDPEKNKIVEVNPVACRMLQFTRAEILSKQVSDIHPHEMPELEDFARSVFREGSGWTRELSCRRKDGHFIPAEISASLIELEGKFILLAIVRDISERKRAEAKLRDSEEQFRAIFEQSSDSMLLTEPANGQIIAFNTVALQTFGYSSEVFSKLKMSDLRPHQSMAESESNVMGVTLKKYRTKAGKIRDFQVTVRAISAHGTTYYLSTLNDITEKREAEEFRRYSRAVFNNATEGITITDAAGNILTVNPAFTEITGYSPEEVIGKSPRILQSGRHDKLFYQAMWHAIHTNGHWQGEIWNRNKNGEIYPESLSITAVKDENGKLIHYTGLFTDITGRKRDEKKLHFQAYYDPLTKLPNRLLLFERLSHAIKQARRHKKKAAVLFVDLDFFKQVNDTLGHLVGDLILRRVAERMLCCVREVDTVARAGGDEFLVVLSNISEKKEAALVADKMIESISKPFCIEGQEALIGASIGIVIVPDDGEEVIDLLGKADRAMYTSKHGGRNRFYFFSTENDEVGKAQTEPT